MLYAAQQRDVALPLLGAILPSNRTHIERTIELVLARQKRRIGLFGLSFKGGTDDLRESPMVLLAEHFIGKGLNLKIYDSRVNLARLMGANKRYIEHAIPHIASLICDTPAEVVTHSEVVIVANTEPAVCAALSRDGNEHQFVIDLAGIRNRHEVRGEYAGVCWQ
jgi:GDP-mannose 6-dehydrogenase